MPLAATDVWSRMETYQSLTRGAIDSDALWFFGFVLSLDNTRLDRVVNDVHHEILCVECEVGEAFVLVFSNIFFLLIRSDLFAGAHMHSTCFRSRLVHRVFRWEFAKPHVVLVVRLQFEKDFFRAMS